MSVDWAKPIALKLPGGELIPAGIEKGYNPDGVGVGNIPVYIYTNRWMSLLQKHQLEPLKSGAPWTDLGMVVDRKVNELTGECERGRIVNVPTDLKPDYYDMWGKMIVVSEVEARRREQQAATGTKAPADQGVEITIAYKGGHAKVVSVENAP